MKVSGSSDVWTKHCKTVQHSVNWQLKHNTTWLIDQPASLQIQQISRNFMQIPRDFQGHLFITEHSLAVTALTAGEYFWSGL